MLSLAGVGRDEITNGVHVLRIVVPQVHQSTGGISYLCPPLMNNSSFFKILQNATVAKRYTDVSCGSCKGVTSG